MKASELRIGNLIEFWSVYDTVILINSINEDTSYANVYLNEIKPIPLTEEWLLKFGFEIIWDSKYLTQYTLQSNMMFHYELDKPKNIWYARFGKYELEHIKYVHQLQNLYFALTGEELTIKE